MMLGKLMTKNLLSLRLIFALTLIAIFAIYPGAGRLSAQTRSVRDGVYTEARAKHGEAVFNEQCANCHNGTVAPSFTDDAFLSKWNGKTVDGLYEVMRKTMPLQKPEGVTDQ